MVEVMKKECVNYVMNKKAAEKQFGKDVVVFDLTEGGMMNSLSPQREWGGLVLPWSGRPVLSMGMAYEGLKEFVRKSVDDSYFVNRKKLGKKREAKSYGRLLGFRCNGELLDLDRGREFFGKWYVDEVKKRWGNVIESLRGLDKDIVLLYEEEDNVFGYVDVLKEIIEGAA